METQWSQSKLTYLMVIFNGDWNLRQSAEQTAAFEHQTKMT
jgi:hypothetical protein